MGCGERAVAGGIEFIAAPFNLDGVQEAIPLLNAAKDTKGWPETLRASAGILIISLRRNYPDLTLDELLTLLDTGNALPAILKVCELSGVNFAPGETAPASP